MLPDQDDGAGTVRGFCDSDREEKEDDTAPLYEDDEVEDSDD
jgi:hypothetical protein